MHRSGTSALARTLNACGCDLPENLIPPLPGNETGHWESRVSVALSDEILASAGTTWDDWEPFNTAWYDSPVADTFRDRAQEVLAGEFGASRLFVLKDPRLCRLLPFWVDAVQRFGAVPLVVSPIRNPLEVAASLAARDLFDPEVGKLIWLRHVIDAEASSRELKRVHVRYDDLLVRHRTVTDLIADRLGIVWPRRSTAVDLELDGFLSPTHRHHRSEDALVIGDSAMSPWIRTAFAILDRWTRDDVRDDDTAALDRIRTAMDEAGRTFSRAVIVGRRVARHAGELTAALDSTRQQVAQLSEAVAQRDAQIGGDRARIEALEAAVRAATEAEQAAVTNSDVQRAALEARIAELDAAIRESETQLATLHTTVDHRNAEVAALHTTVAARDAEIAALTRSVHDRNAEIGALHSAISSRNEQLVAAGTELASRSDELARWTARETASQERTAELERAVACRDEQIGALETAISQRDLQIGAIHQAVAARDAEIAAMRSSTSWRITAPLRETRRAVASFPFSAVGFPLMLGARALRQGPRGPLRDWRGARAVARSDLFDAGWYLATYPDVAAAGIDPARHYVVFGAREGRDPGPKFSTRDYLVRNPDVAAASINPLVHFLLFGGREGRSALPPIAPPHRAERRSRAEPESTPFGDVYAGSDNLARAERVMAARMPAARAFLPGVSVVILNLNRPDLIVPLVDDLSRVRERFFPDGNFEIVIGDTGSRDSDVQALYDAAPPHLTVVRDLVYQFSRSNNICFFGHVHFDKVLFLNNDVRISENIACIADMAAELDRDPNAGAVGLCLYFEDGTLQHGGIDFFTNGPLKGFCHHPGARTRPTDRQDRRQVPAVTGACLMTRSLLFAQLGGFDEGYEAEAQDIDLCLKIGRLGHGITILDRGPIVHLENATRPRGDEHWDDRRRFMRRWSSWIETSLL